MGDEKESTDAKFDSGINQDELILQQQRRIEKEISESTALVGEIESFTSLIDEYSSDEVYRQKVKDLSTKYKSIRRTRPDGNCFYRAFSYAYLERLLGSPEEYERLAVRPPFHKTNEGCFTVIQRYKEYSFILWNGGLATDLESIHKNNYERFRILAAKSKDNLVALGFPQFTVEDFHDTFMEVVDRVGQDSSSFSQKELHKLFNEQGYSDYIVVYLRLITSGQLQKDSEFYQHFIEGDRTVADFCHQEVEPMYKESDHIHIIALSTALNVGVRVRYMDRGEASEVIAHDFPEGSHPAVHLLYRPGHYDILYP